MSNKTIYKKAVAEMVLFDNSDVVSTSENGCPTWTSSNGYTCINGSYSVTGSCQQGTNSTQYLA